MAVKPTGAQHQVGIDELFFSTTDRRGVITAANSVFVRMSRHPLSTLIGAPHNIIRHPDMPGGAFRLVWDELLAGRATCAYVKNLASDGSTYWAFATIVPVDEEFLSVRSRPCHQPTLDLLDDLYATVRRHEHQVRQAGASAAEAAESGAGQILAALHGLGFDSWTDWVQQALPVEVEVRGHQITGLPTRFRASGVHAETLSAASDIEQLLAKTDAELHGFSDRAHALDDEVITAGELIADLDRALVGASVTAATVADRAPVLASSAPALHAQCERVRSFLDTLAGHVHELGRRRDELRFRVALSRLQAEMVGRFAVGVVDGDEDAARVGSAARCLTRALELELATLNGDLQRNVTTAASMTEGIGEARTAFERSQLLVGNWRAIVDRNRLQHLFGDDLVLMDGVLERGGPALAGLDRAAAEFAGSADLNALGLAAGLGRLQRSARRL